MRRGLWEFKVKHMPLEPQRSGQAQLPNISDILAKAADIGLLCDPGGSQVDRTDGAQKSFKTLIETG